MRKLTNCTKYSAGGYGDPRKHGEIIYGGTRWIEDDFSATFSEYIFLFPACLMISHWLTKNAELNSVF